MPSATIAAMEGKPDSDRMSDARCALIVGVSGQDGAYLSRFLLEKGYRVFGTCRRVEAGRLAGLRYLGIQDRVKVLPLSLDDSGRIMRVFEDVGPDEVYNLAGQSSVARSFLQPEETLESVVLGTLNLLEAARRQGRSVRFYNACSGDCFGETGSEGADEHTPFMLRSPYAIAKAASYWLVANYREAYGMHACSGLLFNHESPLRPEWFVTRKIVATACRISKGSSERMELGNLSVRRDWGWAPEYVEAMWRMLQLERPQDFVIATGECRSLREFAEAAFRHLGLELDEHLVITPALYRPTDIGSSRGRADKAARLLGWRARFHMEDVVHAMVEAELGAMGHCRGKE